jgi:23S rRNA (uracil1939-C5)-methyltransferase
MLDITKDTTVIDFYSGIGVTSIMFSKLAKEVISIEETMSSVDNAKFMAGKNNVNNIRFMLGKCEDKITSIKNDDLKDVVLFVDPARAGIYSSVIDAIKTLNPRIIVYMSCNPETCVKDIKILNNDKKYAVSDIKPYNMFPYTKHIETLVCLQRLA